MFAPVYLDHNATTPLHAAVREAKGVLADHDDVSGQVR